MKNGQTPSPFGPDQPVADAPNVLGNLGVTSPLPRLLDGAVGGTLTAEETGVLPEQRAASIELVPYRPDVAHFPNPDIATSFFHPVDHLARTLVWSDIIANTLSADEQALIDRRVLRTAAILHDIGRGSFSLNKHTHGRVAAALIRDDRLLLEALLPQADMGTMSDRQIEDVAYLIQHHHQFDHGKLDLSAGMAESLSVLQTADGLDLTRGNYALGRTAASRITGRTNRIDNAFPIVGHTLRLPQARGLRTIASRYATETQLDIKAGADRFTICLEVAEDMGLLVPANK
jgi:hypothetical protein